MLALFSCQHCRAPLRRATPLCATCQTDLRLGVGATGASVPTAWRLIAPAYPILKTWKKHPGHGWRELLLPGIATLCDEDMRIKEFQPEWVCPVPQGPSRIGTRMTSPAAEVAKLFATALDIPIRSALVIEHASHSLRQAERDGWERRHLPFAWNLRLRSSASEGRYLLVDDFVTSGRTLTHCAAVLSQREGVSVLSAALGSRLCEAAPGSAACSCGIQPCACIA